MSTATMPTPTNTTNITDATLCLSIERGVLGNSRSVSTTQIEVNADKKRLKVSKKLLESKELEAVAAHDRETKAELLKIALPSFFRAGIYLVPLGAFEWAEEYLTKRVAERKLLVDAFMAVYSTRKDEAEKPLGDVYNPMDYPTEAKVRQEFHFEWSWVTFSTPSKLKEIRADLWEQEKQKAAAQWQQATEGVTLLLRQNLKDLVDHMIERLVPDPDGKKKRFHTSNVTNLQEFLANFDMRNITGDKEMSVLVDNCKKLLSGVDVKDLKENEALRDGMAKAFTQVKTFLDGMVVEAGSRKILLEDE